MIVRIEKLSGKPGEDYLRELAQRLLAQDGD
jgi:hypothetical protein